MTGEAIEIELFGMKVVLDPDLPDNRIELRQGDKVVGAIVNLKVPPRSDTRATIAVRMPDPATLTDFSEDGE